MESYSIYELTRRFWRENEIEPLSLSAISLYFFMLDRANTRHWKMPIGCPSEVAAQTLGVTKQTIVKAREALQARGLIRFTAGKGNKVYPKYWLTQGLSDELSDGLSDNFP